MRTRQLLHLALDPSRILAARGLAVDPWQRDVLLSDGRQLLLNCCRQAGKSTVVSALALHHALFQPGSLTLIVSPGQRQSAETFKKVRDNYRALGRPIKARYESQYRLELANASRILCLPGVEGTIRCYSPTLLIIDEAARVRDDLYRSIRPMLAVSRGRLVALSTPFGQRGWFYDAWHGGGPWQRVCVPWRQCPRITAEFIAEEERAMGRDWVAQEYECSFAALAGLVYPDFAQALIDVGRGSPDPAPSVGRGSPDSVGRGSPDPAPTGQRVGGIDWGWRNPFAAVWGVLDRDDVLWIQNERYLRETALHEHAQALPRGVMWYADPASPAEIQEFRVAGHHVRRGMNDIRLGIAAVTARLRTGRLKVVPRRCPSLCAEAKLYRYPSEQERAIHGENPIDEHNHALAALRYLISRIDARFIARLRNGRPTASVEA